MPDADYTQATQLLGTLSPTDRAKLAMTLNGGNPTWMNPDEFITMMLKNPGASAQLLSAAKSMFGAPGAHSTEPGGKVQGAGSVHSGTQAAENTLREQAAVRSANK